MKNTIFFTCISLLVVFSACRKSALSDIEVDDPSILKVYATVKKYCNLDSVDTEVDRITLRIKDKTDHSVELKKGRVLCNNEELEMFTDLVGPFYKLSDENTYIGDNTQYNFIVELADGEQYPGSISIAEDYLKSIEAPESWPWTQDDTLTVSWNEVNEDYSVSLYWFVTFKEGVDHSEMQSSQSIPIIDGNYHKFPSTFFTNTSGENAIDELGIYLRTVKEEEFNESFYRGYSYARFEIVKRVTIN